MPCEARYAEAFDYAVWLQCASMQIGFDDSGGAANAFLTDTTQDWAQGIFRPTVGMALYNATARTYGKITGVAVTVLTTTNTWSNGDEYRIVEISAAEVATVEMFLEIAASDINVARAASGGCDCVVADTLDAYMRKLNVIDAGIYHHCPCGKSNLSDDQKAAFLLWMSDELTNIRTGETELCSGETGTAWPAMGSAERNLTEWNEAQIIINRELRDG